MQATVYNVEGKQVSTVDLSDDVFGITPNVAVMHVMDADVFWFAKHRYRFHVGSP